MGTFFTAPMLTILKYLFGNKGQILEKALLIFLVLLIPFGMNICEILTGGMSHSLMYFAIWFIYLFIILFVSFENNSKLTNFNIIKKAICFGVVILTIFGNIQFANTAYLVKDFDQDATLSFFTRVTEQIENHEEYVSGKTPVVFVGVINYMFEDPYEFSNVRRLIGMNSPSAFGGSHVDYYSKYYKYVLKNNMVFVPYSEWVEFNVNNEEVRRMPNYPSVGSMKLIDDVFVVKLN